MQTLTGAAKVAGVIGWPVAHSLSPSLHGYWLDKYGIDGTYIPIPIAPDDLLDTVRALGKAGFAGANVTVPHKETVRAVVDTETETAMRIGAVNTLIYNDDGSISGDNTDAFGFIEHLKASVPEWQAKAGPVVVLGAGGAARAVIDALNDAGVPEIRLTNRTRERAAALADHFDAPIAVTDWDERSDALCDATLLVNTTTLGMTGKPPLDMALDAMPETGVVYDIVYAPLETPLLYHAKARGLTPVDGLGMLLHQARPGFAAWFGTTPDVTPELRTHILDIIKARG